jgi:alanine or glycine:cation symporter, AGCS family
MVQANSVSHALSGKFAIPELWSGIAMAVMVGLVLIGGIRWIAQVAGKLVPFMAIAYVVGGLVVLAFNIERSPKPSIRSCCTPSRRRPQPADSPGRR